MLKYKHHYSLSSIHTNVIHYTICSWQLSTKDSQLDTVYTTTHKDTGLLPFRWVGKIGESEFIA